MDTATTDTRPCNRRHSASSLIRLTKQMIRRSIPTSNRVLVIPRRSTPKLIHTCPTIRSMSTMTPLTHHPSDPGRAAPRSQPNRGLRPPPKRPNRRKRPNRHRPHRWRRPRMPPRPGSRPATPSRTGIRPRRPSCC